MRCTYPVIRGTGTILCGAALPRMAGKININSQHVPLAIRLCTSVLIIKASPTAPSRRFPLQRIIAVGFPVLVCDEVMIRWSHLRVTCGHFSGPQQHGLGLWPRFSHHIKAKFVLAILKPSLMCIYNLSCALAGIKRSGVFSCERKIES
jgi:hypothetical protein